MRKILSLFILAASSVFLSPRFLLAEKEEKINVLLIVLDAVRPDHLSCYGYSRKTSPNIDNLAQAGVLFSQAFSHGPCTHIAIPSLLTSLYPGVLHKATAWDIILSDKFITLPEILAQAGYVTAAFACPVLKGIPNLKHRFKTYEVLPRETENFPEGELPYLELSLSNIDSEINKKALDWLEKNRSRPFFLYLHYLGGHDPYLPPSPYDLSFWDKEISGEMKKFISGFSRKDYNGLYGVDFPEEMFDFITAQYDGKIKYTDKQIGDLIVELGRLGLLENTLVILTSDHGESFGEHGSFFHSKTLYREVIHVPLIMRLPKVLPRGRVIAGPVRHIDLLPTILDILNIPYGGPAQGIDLLPFITKTEANLELETFSESHESWQKSIRIARWLFIANYDERNEPRSLELYDLETDPNESENLIGARVGSSDERIRLKNYALEFDAKLKEYMFACQKIRSSLLDKESEEQVILDEETKKALKNLGYLQ